MKRFRLALVLVFALLPLIASGVWIAGRAGRPPRLTEPAPPEALAGYTLRREQTLDSEVVSMLEPEWYTMSLYGDDAGGGVWVYVALYAGTEQGGGAHDPAVCYPAQGWDATEALETPLALGDGSEPVVKVLSASQGGREELVMYWFQPSRRWPAHATPEIFLRMLDRLEGRPEYAFVRLSTGVDRLAGRTSVEGEERLRRVAGALAPWVRRLVSGDVD